MSLCRVRAMLAAVRSRSRSIAVLAIASALPLVDVVVATAQGPDAVPQTVIPAGKLSQRLARLVTREGPLVARSRGRIRIDSAGRVQVYVWTREVTPQLLDDLAGFGGLVERMALDVVQAWVPVSALTTLAQNPAVRSVEPPVYARPQTGSVTAQGDQKLGAKPARTDLGVTGQGVRVGVLSMGLAGLADSIASEDLPPDTTFHCKTPPGAIPSLTVVQRLNACGPGELLERTSGAITAWSFKSRPDLEKAVGGNPSGEGTAMLEIVHDLAPGAELWFAAAETSLEILAALDWLAAHVDVVISDLGFPGYFPNGKNSMSQAVAAIIENRRARAFVQAAGNLADRQHYTGTYKNSGTQRFHLFEAIGGTQGPTTGSSTNWVQVKPQSSLTISLSWDDDPPGAATSDYDLLLFNCPDGVPRGDPLDVDGGTDVQDGPDSEPQEFVEYFNDKAQLADVCYAIKKVAVAPSPRRLNVTLDDPDPPVLHQFSTPAKSLLAPADVEEMIAVGAVSHLALTTIEPFSSRGPTFDGRPKPDLVATDGVWITGAGGFGRTCGTKKCFDGTSAAAPHVAAIAALVLDANPGLARDQLKDVLMQTAVALGDENVFGAGRVDAQAAAELAQSMITTNPLPALDALVPDNGPANGQDFVLTVTGSGFVPSSVIRWNAEDRSTAFVSSGELRATIPGSAVKVGGRAAVGVFTPPAETTPPGGGLSDTRDFTITAVPSDAPTVSSLAPTSGVVAGGPAFTLTVNGNNFTESSTVRWNGSPRETTYVKKTRIEATIPASDITNAGSAEITVFNPGGGGISNAKPFTIKSVAPKPRLISISPTTATVGSPGFSLIVTGADFISGSRVIWGDAGPRLTQFVSPTELRVAILPTDLIDDDVLQVWVNTPPPGGGDSDTKLTFTITAGGGSPPSTVPAINTLVPSSASTGGAAFTLTVNGSNFGADSKVRWNGTERTTTFVSSTQLLAAIPASDIASAGTAQLAVTSGAGTSNQLPFTISSLPPAPVLLVLDPASTTAGGADFTLTVNGSNFASSSKVRWNGADRQTSFVSSTQLRASIPAGDISSAGSAEVTVSTPAPGGGVSAPLSFAITNHPLPVISTVAPSSINAGSFSFLLTVTGSNFVSGSKVRWNGADRQTSFVSSTQLRATILAGDILSTGSAEVTVSNPAPAAGVSAPLSFAITNSVPLVGGLNPGSIPAGGAAVTLRVLGQKFVNSSTIRWNGVDRETTFVSSTELQTLILASELSTPGAAQVTVFTPPPGGGVSTPALTFTIGNPLPPVISGLAPGTVTAGDLGFTLTVNGSNFVRSSIVHWKGTPRMTTFVSNTELRATIPALDIASAGTAQVRVFTPSPGGGFSMSLTFTITNPVPPVIGTLVPGSAMAGDVGFTLTVNGGNFIGSSTVRWNGAARPTTFVSSTQLQALIPASDIASAGSAEIRVLTPSGDGLLSGPMSFTINPAPPAPLIGSLVPSGIIAGGPGITLAVNGSAFVSGTTVRWNGVDRPTTFVSSTQLQVALSTADILAAGMAEVRVFTPSPGGGLSLPLPFTINNPLPVAVALDPGGATAGGSAFSLLVNGSGFVVGSKVRWNGSDRPTTFVSPTQLQASISASDIASATVADVTTVSSAPGGGTSQALTFTISAPAPTDPLEAFVAGFYQNVLGRNPDASGLAGWKDFLLQSPDPDGARMLVQGFFNSAENMRQPMTLATYVRLLYRTILQREPADAEVETWVRSGMLPALNVLVPGFAGSQEFQGLLLTTPPPEIIHRFYLNVLGRSESADENAAWVDVVTRTGDWEAIAIGFLNSPEYIGGTRSLAGHVTVLYRTFLGREPDEGGLTYWLTVLAQELKAIQLGFTLSPEFQGRVGELFRL